MEPGRHTGATRRLLVAARGAVQGVGFRPFVYRLATEMGLAGTVRNSGEGVTIEVEGPGEALEAFLLRLSTELPAPAILHGLEPVVLDPAGYHTFEILPSNGGPPRTLVLPDIATCPACLSEIFDPADRRYLYPFTNCTHCGPRFTIVERLPYDRANTSMRQFRMCPACQAEYDDPSDRRFHAQPNACPECGPRLQLLDPSGRLLAERHDALLQAADALRGGAVVAVKGLGGFHLMVDARSETYVRELRERKHREEKPFAVMFPTLEAVQAACRVSPLEARLLRSPEAPIVLLEGDLGNGLLAPGNPYLGVMLPYTPLHHILMRELGFPVVATSGNRSEEPICTDERDALVRLSGLADLFLVHDRPIVRHVDDSILRVSMGRELVMRRARGYAPLPVRIPGAEEDPTTLAVGAHLKNTVALSVGPHAFVSQHIGDLETAAALEAFHRIISDFEHLYEAPPARIACDLHPDYQSTRFARESGRPVIAVQHHYAHVLACMAENQIDPPVLGVSWDGTGYGTDGTIWGGEFLRITDTGFERAGHLLPFPLPGGEAAVREPRRTAAGLMYMCLGGEWLQDCFLPIRQQFSAPEWKLLMQMLQNAVNTPITTSAGRLFDGVAALTGLCSRMNFEGQAAMMLEFAAGDVTGPAYPFKVECREEGCVLDWRPMILEICRDVDRGTPVSTIAAHFHETLAEGIVEMAKAARRTPTLPSPASGGGETKEEPSPASKIVLTGGCFQNRRLTETTIRKLEQAGFRPYWHQRIPPNDGGISLGQIAAVHRMMKEQPEETQCASPSPVAFSA